MWLVRFLQTLLMASLLLGGTAGASTYWVSSKGSDENSCSSVRGDKDPGRYRSVDGGLACMSPGDTLMVKNGTYNYSFPRDPIPSGISPSQKTCIVGESRDGVIFRPDASNSGNVFFFSAARSNLCFRNFTLDGINQSTSGSKTGIRQGGTRGNKHNWDLTDLVIKNFGINLTEASGGPSGNGIVIDGSNTNMYMARLVLLNNGTPGQTFGNGIYWRGGNSILEYSYIEGSTNNNLHFNNGENASGNIVRYNILKDAAVRNIHFTSDTPNALVHNNILIGSPRSINVNATNTRVYNNTVWGGNSLYCIRLESGASNSVVRNNIFLNCGGSAITNNSSGSTISHNLISGKVSDIFVDHGAGNFRLKPSSPAIDAGATINSITSDLDGTAIPQGCCYDIGAYEYRATLSNPPPAPSNLGIASQ